MNDTYNIDTIIIFEFINHIIYYYDLIVWVVQ